VPVDVSSATVTVNAPLADVLAVVRDIESYPEWLPGFRVAEVLEENPDGTPATARFTVEFAIGKDTYDVAYEHHATDATWTLVRPTSLQKAQRGVQRLEAQDGSTVVTMELEIDHNVPAPGFMRRRIFASFVDNATKGLKSYVER
jgi:ribosome-associated toxin RatA of RatAB toxin-antitoxin module